MIIYKIFEKERIQDTLDLFAESLESLSRGKEFRSAMAAKFAAIANVIVLEDNGQIQAFAAFYTNDMSSFTAFLSMIAVLPKYRGKGIAKKLLDTICAEAEKRKMVRLCLEVKKNNPSAERFYLNNQFSVIEERSDSRLMERKFEEKENG